MTGQADDAITVERRIGAPPSVVYGYLTESAKWARWQGDSADIEPVPGGRFRMHVPNGAVAEGRFVELVPNRRVVFTWGWDGHPTVPPGSSTVSIELIADGEGTLVRLVHSGVPAADRSIHVIGWEHYLPRLALAATGRDPGPDAGPG